jgi:hypothetical protein
VGWLFGLSGARCGASHSVRFAVTSAVPCCVCGFLTSVTVLDVKWKRPGEPVKNVIPPVGPGTKWDKCEHKQCMVAVPAPRTGGSLIQLASSVLQGGSWHRLWHTDGHMR